MSNNLKWLHISDIHFHPKTDWRDNAARESLLKYLENTFREDESLHPDLIFCTGDIAFGETGLAPLAKQYEQAVVFFNDLLRICGREGETLSKDRLFVVPGNHDINRNRFNRDAQETLTNKAKRPHQHVEEINRRFSECSSEFKDAVKRLYEYDQFIQSFLPHQHDSEGRCFYTRVINIEGLDIGIAGFNSAWSCSGPEDDRHLWLAAKWQCNTAESAIKTADIRFGLIHHPTDWLNESDRDIMTRRIPGHFHFWLHGHSHNAWVVPGASHITIAAGAVGAQERDEFGFNLGCFNKDESKGTIHLHTYSPRDNGWTITPVANHAPKGIWHVHLSSCAHIDSISSVPSTTPSPQTTAPYNPANRIFNVPFRAKGDQVVGREEALQQVKTQLTEGRCTAIGHTAAFEGLGGLGKTQLAVEFAYQFSDIYPSGVIWINADQDINAQLTEIAVSAKWIAPETEHKVKFDIALHRLKTFSNGLIIFDNVEDFSDIEPYFPRPEATPHILVTSRNPLPGFAPIQLDPLNPGQSLQLLLQESGRQITASSEENAAREIVAQLDGLPLALEMAGAYLCHRSTLSFANYRDLLTADPIKTLRNPYLASFTKHDADLFKTLKIEEEIFSEEPLLKEVLDLLTWSSPASMGISLLSALVDQQVTEILGALSLGVQLKLLQKSGTDRYALHRLVREVRRCEQPLTNHESWINNICEKLGKWFEKIREDFLKLPLFEAEIDHLVFWRENAVIYPSHACRLTWLSSYPGYHRGMPNKSQEHLLKAEKIYSDSMLSDLELYANLLNDLGITFCRLSKFQKALEHLEKALNIQLNFLGENHQTTALIYNNIAVTYGEIGNQKKGLEYIEKSINIYLNIYDKPHPEIARAYINAGTNYRQLGENKKALEYQEKALQLYKNLLGERHPNTAHAYNSIGITYDKLNDYKNSFKYKEKALEVRRELLGERHPDTAQSYYSIGITYNKLDNHQKALEYAKISLEIYCDILSECHINTINSYFNVGLSHSNLGNFDKALHFLQIGQRCAKNSLPQKHPLHRQFENGIRQVTSKTTRPGFRPPSKHTKKKKRR